MPWSRAGIGSSLGPNCRLLAASVGLSFQLSPSFVVCSFSHRCHYYNLHRHCHLRTITCIGLLFDRQSKRIQIAVTGINHKFARTFARLSTQIQLRQFQDVSPSSSLSHAPATPNSASLSPHFTFSLSPVLFLSFKRQTFALFAITR